MKEIKSTQSIPKLCFDQVISEYKEEDADESVEFYDAHESFSLGAYTAEC